MPKKRYDIEELLPVGLEMVVKIYANPNRKKILKILQRAKKPMNILQVKKKMDLSYKGTYNHIQKLADVGLVKLNKNDRASGQAVTVEYTADTAIKKLS